MNEWWKINKKKSLLKLHNVFYLGFVVTTQKHIAFPLEHFPAQNFETAGKWNQTLFFMWKCQMMRWLFFHSSQRAQWHSNYKTLQTNFVRYVRRRKKQLFIFAAKKKKRTPIFFIARKNSVNRLFVRKFIWWRFNFVGNMGAVLGLASAAQASASNRIYIKRNCAHRLALCHSSRAYSGNFYLSLGTHVAFEYIIMISRIYGNQFLFALSRVIRSRSIITNDKVKEQPSLSHMHYATRLFHTFS